MHMSLNSGSSKTIVYFHANAEDMVLCGELLDYLRALLKVNVIAVEYPGYGIYTGAFQSRHNYTHQRSYKSYKYPHEPKPPIIDRESFGKTPRFGELDAFKEKSRQVTLKSKVSADRSASAFSRGVYNANLSDSEEED